MAVGKKRFEKGVILHTLNWKLPAAIKFTAKSYWKIWQSVERFTVNYLYFELETSRYLIVIAKMLSLGKAPINLVLSHLKKNHSLVIIQLCISAIFSPVFSATLNFCWHQERDWLSASCSLVAFAGIMIVLTTWDWSIRAAKRFWNPHY